MSWGPGEDTQAEGAADALGAGAGPCLVHTRARMRCGWAAGPGEGGQDEGRGQGRVTEAPAGQGKGGWLSLVHPECLLHGRGGAESRSTSLDGCGPHFLPRGLHRAPGLGSSLMGRKKGPQALGGQLKQQ